MSGRRTAALALAAPALALVVPQAAAVPDVRTATPRDNAAHTGPDNRTEWWFVNAVDPRTGLAVAAALGTEFPGAPPAAVVFVYPPGGGEATTIGAPRLRTADPSTVRADVRLGPDRLWSPAAGVVRIRTTMAPGIVFSGPDPGPVALDLTLRGTAPGFVAGPLALPGDQDLSWTVAAPSARVSGTVRVGDRTYRLRGVPGYHDHNFGDFDLGDQSHGGWDWSQVHLPGGRSLVTGIVRPQAPAPRDGVSVLSGRSGRLGVAGADAVAVERSAWATVDGHPYPRRLVVRAELSGGWTATVRYRARRALPLEFSQDGRNALVEVEARASGELRRGGRVVARWAAAPGFYEYESTPVTRERDATPGSVTRTVRITVAALRGAARPA